MKHTSILLMCLALCGCGSSAAETTAQDSQAAGPNDNTTIGGNQPAAGSSCPGLATTQFMIPCPQLTGNFPEILIKSSNSVLLVTPMNNNQMGFTARPAGSYVTQDGRNCSYTVNADGSLQ